MLMRGGENWAGYQCCRWTGNIEFVAADGCAVRCLGAVGLLRWCGRGTNGPDGAGRRATRVLYTILHVCGGRTAGLGVGTAGGRDD